MARLGCAALGLAVAMVPSSRLWAGEVDGSGAKAAVAQTAAKVDGANVDKGRTLFATSGCGNCHTLAAAGVDGEVGPPLDGDSNLTTAFVVDRVTNGQGGMPPFGGQLSGEEIADVAAYVVQAAAK